ncbi:hypothetical protein tinsulaeT_20770 [Thalassotalea insulae]|uniref:Fibronectin type-III domain-containing protein n=1 Tax=Thalassotalea insulae TaxID=2056778 RepID=A0ABQ6GVS1_9GAMM|nr:Ig-like domain-containing protein [Thalassotalea insulae]GLX78737.1 hypothetical protein tinsulaeT_20770 [Thalassotalea insulae]
MQKIINGVVAFLYLFLSNAIASNLVPILVGNNVFFIPVEMTPVAQDDSLVTTGENKVYYLDVVANDSDADNESLAIKAITQPVNGSVTFDNTTVVAYTPNTDYCGDDSFSYTIIDESNNEAQATVNVSCDNSYVPPLSTPKLLKTTFEFNSTLPSIQEEFLILTNDVIQDDNYSLNELRIQLNAEKTYEQLGFYDSVYRTNVPEMLGSVVSAYNTLDSRWLQFKNKILYQWKASDVPNPAGKVEEINFRVMNPDGNVSDWATLRISLDGAFEQNYNYYPMDDSATTEQEQMVIIPVLNNDPQVQTYYEPKIYVHAKKGSVRVNSDRTISYTPYEGLSGTDSFSYKVADDDFYEVNSAPATVTVTVTGQNQAPVAVDDLMSVVQGSASTTYDVIANDTDAENDFIYLLSVGSAQHGAVSMHSNRAVKYIPDNGACQTDSFTYVVSQDLQGTLSDTGTVNVECIDESVPQVFHVPPVTQPNGTVDISWQAPIKAGVVEYEVQGELKGRLTKKAFVADTDGIFHFERAAPAEGREYCYKVRAWFGDGTYGSYSPTLCTLVSSTGEAVLEAPAFLTYTHQSAQEVMMSWGSIPGAEKYLVELQTTASTTSNEGNQWQAVYYGGQSSQLLRFSAFHKQIHDALGRLTYRVSGCNALGVCGNYAREPLKTLTTDSFLATVPAEHKVPACIDLPAQVAAGQNIPVSFCPSQVSNVQSYELYGELAGVVVEDAPSDFAKTSQGLNLVVRPALPEGKEYCYKLDAKLTDGSTSGYTDKLCTLVGELVFEAPTEFLAIAANTGFNHFDLLWTPLTGAHHYQLEQETYYGVWQMVSCTPDSFTYNNQSYQRCGVEVTDEDIVPEIGKMVYRVSACNVGNVCGNYQRVNFELMSALAEVYQTADGSKLYLQLADGQYIELERDEHGAWQGRVLTQAEWDAISPTTNLSISGYSLENGDFSGDGLADFKLINGSEEILLVQSETGAYQQALGRKVIFIHTDILGTPVAETGVNGAIN